MPQLSQIGEIYASQLFWLVIVFALIYFGIGRAMVPKIERTVDQRNARISGDLAAAASARDRANELEQTNTSELEAARNSARLQMAEAKSKASASAEARVREGGKRDEERLAAAITSIEQRKREAMAELESTTVDVVQEIISRFSGVEVDRGTIEQRVKAELSHG
ncbi:ATPase [Sphingomonas tabacisoli]|uniref:ATP synthase subunit b n=1 Tax=Sphingomonas tabacisoli TaxID=2249466 RepID=A0ABW4I4A2_9SPHN